MRVEPLLGDDFERLRDAGLDHDFEAGVEVFGVFAEDDEVDVGVVGLQAGKRLDGAEIGVEVELLAQRDVDRREAAADGRGDGAFEGDAVLVDGPVELLGDVLAGLGVGIGAGIVAMPVEGAAGLLAGGFEDGDCGGGDFGADAVAGDEGDFVRARGFLQHGILRGILHEESGPFSGSLIALFSVALRISVGPGGAV